MCQKSSSKVDIEIISRKKRGQIHAIALADPHAPLYHFIPPEGQCWSFDPNGAIFWQGRYHLFYLFQDPARKSGTEFWQTGHCWGHASSVDLLHWDYHPTALAPEPGDPEVAIYSGCAFFTREGRPAIAYHGYDAGTCLAFPEDDDLITWCKSPFNPVIPEPKEGEAGWGIYNVFDPHVWYDGEQYCAILGGQVKPADVRDTAYLFTSPDLQQWTYAHPFYTPNPAWTGESEDCACPDFFSLGDRHMLLCISHARGARYYIGRYADGRFIPEEHHQMNWPGGPCFAPETLLDGKNRRIMWAWVLDQRRASWQGGALGVFTLPRVLSLVDGALHIAPPAEFAALRRNHWQLNTTLLTPGVELLLPITGDCLEIEIEVNVLDDGEFVFKLRVSPDATEQTVITYDAEIGELAIDTSHSSLSGESWHPYPLDFWKGFEPEDISVQRAPFRLSENESLHLRVFLDRSILEVFANDRLCMTQRLYPSLPDSMGGVIFSRGGQSVIRSLHIWQMRPVNQE